MTPVAWRFAVLGGAGLRARRLIGRARHADATPLLAAAVIAGGVAGHRAGCDSPGGMRMARPRRPGRRDRRHGDWRPAALGHRRRRLRRADRSRRDGDRLRDRGSPPGERRGHGPDQHGRRPAGARGPRAGAGPPDRQRGARERDARRSRGPGRRTTWRDSAFARCSAPGPSPRRASAAPASRVPWTASGAVRPPPWEAARPTPRRRSCAAFSSARTIASTRRRSTTSSAPGSPTCSRSRAIA